MCASNWEAKLKNVAIRHVSKGPVLENSDSWRELMNLAGTHGQERDHVAAQATTIENGVAIVLPLSSFNIINSVSFPTNTGIVYNIFSFLKLAV